MNFKTARSLTLAGCLAMMCAACSASGEPPVARVLPPPPDLAKPVDVAQPRKGESAVAVAARERAGRVAANGRIVAFREWYEALRKAYSQ